MHIFQLRDSCNTHFTTSCSLDKFNCHHPLYINCLEHTHVKYMPLTHDKRVELKNNQYVSYALLSLAGNMHLTFLCSKQLNYVTMAHQAYQKGAWVRKSRQRFLCFIKEHFTSFKLIPLFFKSRLSIPHILSVGTIFDITA